MTVDVPAGKTGDDAVAYCRAFVAAQLGEKPSEAEVSKARAIIARADMIAAVSDK